MRRSFAINLKKSPEIRVTTRLSLQENIEEEQIALERTVKAKTIRELRAIKDEYENDRGNQEKVKLSYFQKMKFCSILRFLNFDFQKAN